MCGRYTLTSGLTILQRRFGFSAEQISLEPRYNLAPGQEAPVVICEENNTIRMMRWGLVPFWAKEASIGYQTKVIGDIAHETLTIEAGAHFEGRVQPLESVVPELAAKLARA